VQHERNKSFNAHRWPDAGAEKTIGRTAGQCVRESVYKEAYDILVKIDKGQTAMALAKDPAFKSVIGKLD